MYEKDPSQTNVQQTQDHLVKRKRKNLTMMMTAPSMALATNGGSAIRTSMAKNSQQGALLILSFQQKYTMYAICVHGLFIWILLMYL